MPPKNKGKKGGKKDLDDDEFWYVQLCRNPRLELTCCHLPGRKRKLFSSNPGPLFKPMKLPRRVIKLTIVSLTFWKMETLCLMKRVVV